MRIAPDSMTGEVKEQVFLLPLPPSVNSLYRNVPGRGRVKTKEYRSWQAEAGWLVMMSRPKKIIGKVRMTIRAVKPDKRRRDLANLEKAISDLMVDMGVIEDDSLIEALNMEWVSDNLSGVSVYIQKVEVQ